MKTIKICTIVIENEPFHFPMKLDTQVSPEEMVIMLSAMLIKQGFKWLEIDNMPLTKQKLMIKIADEVLGVGK